MSNGSFLDLRLLTVSEVAQILKMNEQAVLKKLQNRDIKGYKLGKEWRIKEEDIMAWFEGLSNWNLRRELQSQVSAELVEEAEREVGAKKNGKKGKQATNEELLKKIVSKLRETGQIPTQEKVVGRQDKS